MALKRIAEFRVKQKIEGVGSFDAELEPLSQAVGLSAEDFVATYRRLAPLDDFSKFCQLIEDYSRS